MIDLKEIEARKLRALVARLKRLQGEDSDITGEIEEIYAEAWNAGFDVQLLDSAVARRGDR